MVIYQYIVDNNTIRDAQCVIGNLVFEYPEGGAITAFIICILSFTRLFISGEKTLE